MRNPELWERLSRYDFLREPDGKEAHTPRRSRLAFLLGQNEHWTDEYAMNAVEEYRRFVYLARVADGKVTPSEIVDRVWHAHITDSGDYVDGFCRALFGEILHHEPATGPADRPRHEAQFAATRTLYEAEFGEVPPPDFWYHNTPKILAAARRRASLAKIAGFATGIAVTWLCHRLFGGVAGALFTGCVAGSLTALALSPKVPGPHLKSSDSGGCGSCGD
jgi:hypothetical protein